MKLHISISQCLVLIIPIAVGLAAITNPSAFWEGTVFALGLILLFTAILGVLYREGGGRAFWLGFSIFGWGIYLLCSDISFEFRPSASVATTYSPVSPSFWFDGSGTEDVRPVHALVRSVFDFLELDRRARPKSVGEKIQVQWGSPSSYYPSSVLEIKGDQFKIRYQSDAQGTYDEWVGTSRIKLIDAERGHRIGVLLFAQLFALIGAVIARFLHATRKLTGPTLRQ
jgi:hypothetical protein